MKNFGLTSKLSLVVVALFSLLVIFASVLIAQRLVVQNRAAESEAKTPILTQPLADKGKLVLNDGDYAKVECRCGQPTPQPTPIPVPRPVFFKQIRAQHTDEWYYEGDPFQIGAGVYTDDGAVVKSATGKIADNLGDISSRILMTANNDKTNTTDPAAERPSESDWLLYAECYEFVNDPRPYSARRRVFIAVSKKMRKMPNWIEQSRYPDLAYGEVTTNKGSYVVYELFGGLRIDGGVEKGRGYYLGGNQAEGAQGSGDNYFLIGTIQKAPFCDEICNVEKDSDCTWRDVNGKCQANSSMPDGSWCCHRRPSSDCKTCKTVSIPGISTCEYNKPISKCTPVPPNPYETPGPVPPWP